MFFKKVIGKAAAIVSAVSVALAAAVAMAPEMTAKAAEVTVTTGSFTWTLSEMPVAAFEVTGFGAVDWMNSDVFISYEPFILYCVPEGTEVSSQSEFCYYEADISGGRDTWRIQATRYGNKYMDPSNRVSETFSYRQFWKADAAQQYGYGYTCRFQKLYPASVSETDAVYGVKDSIFVMAVRVEDGLDGLSEVFARAGATLTSISVEDALARSGQAVPEISVPTIDETAQMTTDETTNVTDQMTTDEADQVTADETPQVAQVIVSDQTTYTVEAGDNLCKIAKKVYGDEQGYMDIYNANINIIKSNYMIYKGQVLIIPAR